MNTRNIDIWHASNNMASMKLLAYMIVLYSCIVNAQDAALFYRRKDLNINSSHVIEVFETRGRFECASYCARASYCRSSAYDTGMLEHHISILTSRNRSVNSIKRILKWRLIFLKFLNFINLK